MVKLTNILVFLFLMLMITSCEEDFVLERNHYEPKIVINSLFKPGENWSVHISKSRDLLAKDSDDTPIDNAKVYITEKKTSQQIRLQHVGNGIYTSTTFPPLPDRTYEIVVDVEGFKTATASSKAPLNANIVNVISDVVDKEVTKVNFEVKDNISNYLIWNFISNGSQQIDTTHTSNPQKFVQDIVKYNNISNYLSNLTISENNAITQEGSFTRNFKDNYPEYTDSTTTTVTKKYLRVMTASQDLYEYFISMEKFISAGNHNSSFSYAPSVYSNINNGLGIFAGFTEEYKEIK